MTTPPGDDFSELPLVSYVEHKPEDLITVELEAGNDTSPPLLVRFRAPDPMDLATIEARARDATLSLLRGSEELGRYGLATDQPVDETVVGGLAPLISSIESGALLIKDWNLAVPGSSPPVKAKVDFATVSQLFKGRPRVRAAWNLHLDNASPLERIEGNASAGSPNTTSGAPATTADPASS